jgi:hypothetical protein
MRTLGFLLLTIFYQAIKSRIKWAGCATYKEKRNACGILVVKPEGTTAPGRPRHRWKDNIKMVLRSGMD